MTILKNINLIPKEALRRPLFRQLKGLYKNNVMLRILSVALIFIAVMSVIQIVTVFASKIELSKAKQQEEEAKVKLRQLESQYLGLEKAKAGLIKEEEAKQNRLEMLISTSSMDKRYSKLLVLIAGLVPQDVWVNHFVLDEGEVRIIGSTLNNQLITQFMNRLDESKSFKNSRFTSSEKHALAGHIVYNFQITTEPILDSPLSPGGEEG